MPSFRSQRSVWGESYSPPLSSYPALPAQFSLHCRSFPTLLRTHGCAPSHFSRVRLFVTPWTAARQAPLSMGFSRQEYWGGLPCPPPGDLPGLGAEPASLALLPWQAGSLPLVPPGKPLMHIHVPIKMHIILVFLACIYV